jgi:ribosomal protein S18 acetylase RimI-like enzyme
VLIRDALPGELPAVGDLRVAAYVADGFLAPTSGYAPRLRALGTQGDGSVLVAVTQDTPSGRPEAGGQIAGGQIVGTIMLQLSPHAAEIVTSPDEAEIRALAVAPGTQGQGIGRALLQAALQRAAGLGVRQLVLSTKPEMHAAHRLYERAGFRRLPERDWYPDPETELLVYGLLLADSLRAGGAA